MSPASSSCPWAPSSSSSGWFPFSSSSASSGWASKSMSDRASGVDLPKPNHAVLSKSRPAARAKPNRKLVQSRESKEVLTPALSPVVEGTASPSLVATKVGLAGWTVDAEDTRVCGNG
eukprot:190306-Prymnesium_polylepis.1